MRSQISAVAAQQAGFLDLLRGTTAAAIAAPSGRKGAGTGAVLAAAGSGKGAGAGWLKEGYAEASATHKGRKERERAEARHEAAALDSDAGEF